MLERYRRTMNIDVLHSWALDAQDKIDEQSHILAELKSALKSSYEMSDEGREYLRRIDAAMYK